MSPKPVTTNDAGNQTGSSAIGTQEITRVESITPLPTYVHIRLREPGERVHHTQMVYHGVLLDFDKDNRLIGVEVLP